MDPITAIGLAASIYTFVQIGVKVITRLKEYNETVSSAPAWYKELSETLDLLIQIVKSIEEQSEKRKVNGGVATLRALVTVVHGCMSQIELLDGLLDKVSPCEDDTFLERQRKGWRSIRLESEVQAIYSKISRYQSTLMLYQVSPLQPGPAIVDTNPQIFYEVPESRLVPYFVGRRDLIADLEERLDNYPHKYTAGNTPTIILLGMGGQGKTQIALKFCQRAHRADNYENRRFYSIFWIDASTVEAARKGFQRIYAAISKEQQTTLDENSQIQFVKDTVKKWKFPWLIIFDNYDDPSSFSSLEDFIPGGAYGSVLITSRHEDAGLRGEIINVPGLAKEDAVDLLISQSKPALSESVLNTAEEIVTRLGYLALAIHQAGAYAFKHPPLSKFLDSFETEKSKVLKWTPCFWQYKRITGRNTEEQPLNAFITFELSVRNLDTDADIRDNVVQFMTISSYLHTENISEELLKQFSTPSNSCLRIFLNPTGEWDGNKFFNILVKLRETALVQSFSPEERCFSLHPVVSDWLKCRNQEKEMAEAQRLDRFTASKLVKNYINATVKDLGLMYLGLPYDIRQSALLHVTACIGDAKTFAELDTISNEWEDIAHCFADFLDSVGDYTTAQVLQEEVVRKREQKPKDMFSLRVQGVLAKIYHHQGRFEKVNEIMKQVEDLSEEALKRGNLDALTLADIRIRNLAWQEKFDEAEDEVRLLIQVKSKALKAEDRSLLKSRSMLAWILENRGKEEKLKEAELLNDEVLNLRRQAFGETDLDTLTSYNAKGVLYHMTGRLPEAEELIRKAATGREDKLGRTHPDTLNVLTNLSMVLAAQHGKIGEAEKLARFVLRSRRERLGKAHISTLVSIANLVHILTKEDPRGEKYSLEIEGLKDQLQSLEKNGHPSISKTLEADLKILRTDADARVVPVRGIRDRALGGTFFRIIAGKRNRSEFQSPAKSSRELAMRNMQSQMQVQQ